MDCESSKSERENIKQSESKQDELVSDAVADKETAEDKGADAVNEETQKEANDEKPAGIEIEDEDQKDEKTANADNYNKSCENADSTAEGVSLSSFQHLSSSQNAFTGLAGTGFSTSSFSFASNPMLDGSTSSVHILDRKMTSLVLDLVFQQMGTLPSSRAGTGFPAMQEVPVETGEENEKMVFSADSVLFEFIVAGWKEHGKGELKLKVSTTGTAGAQILMRARRNYRLILNANLYPDMKLTNMEKKGSTFACMNCTGEDKEVYICIEVQGCFHAC